MINIRDYIVILNAGSGCIFQPMDDAHTYVLTAKHNIRDNKITQFVRFRLNENNNWDEINIPLEALVENENYFPHPDKDIAIIKIEKIPDLENIIRFDEIDVDSSGYILAGYPEARRISKQKENWFRRDEDVTIMDIKYKHLREAKLPGNAGYDAIVGQSGGGILKISGDYILLAGIQNKMADAYGEQLGRVEFSPIYLFDEIIETHQEQLSPLNPPYYKSFKFLKDHIMNLEECIFEDNVEYTKRYLKNITDEIIKNQLTPNIIRNKLNKRMLCHDEKEDCFSRKGLWIAWLEFFIVLKVLGKDPQTEQELEDVFNKYRIIYSSSEKGWGNFFVKAIYYSDYKGLKAKDYVIFANDDDMPATTILRKGVVTNISKDISTDYMKIDEGIKNPIDSFNFIHIKAFQKNCILEKEQEYSRFNFTNNDKLLKKLKKEYEKIIKN